ncbi:MAG: L,D-transpeptidase family protein, partial [Planctomycetota bacterium]
LRRRRWPERVGRARGLWISAARQRLHVIDDDLVVRSYVCSTALAGVGNRDGSGCTPDGWHRIAAGYGQGLPLGAVLRGRLWTNEVWSPGGHDDEDLILSRILRLEGLEAGHNRGGDVDTWNRYIYIHGTNSEGRLGQPVSHGCVRLANRDVIELFDLVQVGDSVLITPT